MKAGPDENNIAAIRTRQREAVKSTPKVGAATERSAAERPTAKPLASNDGRRERSTGRTVQLNVLIRPEVREHLRLAALSQNKTMVSLIEEAILSLALED